MIGISNWQEFQRDGEQFLHTALMAKQKDKKHFTPEILYNLTGMAIEKFIMAYLMKNGDLAENHTMEDLLTALERHVGSQHHLTEKFRFLDSFQEICDMDSIKLRKPDEKDIQEILNTGQEIRDLLTPLLSN